jgi:predicted MFS family arabinose efflux permease
MRGTASDTDLRRILLYGIISRLYFHLPILFVFLFLRNYGVFRVEALLAAYGVALTLASRAVKLLPSQLSQRTIVAIGEAVKAVGLLIILVAPPYWGALLGQVLAGIGFGLTAGRETALLRAVAPPERATVLQGNLQSYIFASTLIGGVVGSVLFRAAHWLPFVASILAIVVATAVIATVSEPRPEATSVGQASQPRPTVGSERALWMSYYIVSRALAMALFVGFLPYLFFAELHLPVAVFGVVLGLYSVAALISARFAVRVGARIGARRTAGIGSILVVVAVVLFWQGSLALSLIGITLLGVGAGGVRPLGLAGLDLQALPAPARGRLLERQEQIFGVLNAAALVGGGAVLANASFGALMLVFAGCYAAFVVAFAVGSWNFRRPHAQEGLASHA